VRRAVSRLWWGMESAKRLVMCRLVVGMKSTVTVLQAASSLYSTMPSAMKRASPQLANSTIIAAYSLLRVIVQSAVSLR